MITNKEIRERVQEEGLLYALAHYYNINDFEDSYLQFLAESFIKQAEYLAQRLCLEMGDL